MKHQVSSWLGSLARMRVQLLWILFLAVPATYLSVAPSSPWRVALGVFGIVAQCVIYLGLLVVVDRVSGPDGNPSPSAPWRRHAAGIVGLQLAATAALVPALGPGAIPVLSFIVPAVAFLMPLKPGLVTAGAVGVFAVVAATMSEGIGIVWAWGPVVWVAIMLIFTRLSMSSEYRASELRVELALSKTREGVASDVHDLLGHSLSLITVKAELAKRLLDSDPDAAAAELTDIVQLSREATGEVRATVQQLQAPDLNRQLTLSTDGLRAAGITPDVHGSPDLIDPDQRRLAAWVLRKASTNVVRHSAASHCRIDFQPDALTITDDGRGISADATGHGLGSMRRRAAALGAELAIHGSADGTVVRLEFP